MRRWCTAIIFAVLIPSPVWSADSKASRLYEDALARFEKADYAGASIQLKNALQIDSEMLSAHLLLGKALLANGEVAAAEVALLEALRLGVSRTEVAVPLGQAFLAQGRHKQLFERPEMMLDGLPGQVKKDLLLLRATAKAELGDFSTAITSVEAARALAPEAADSWLVEVPIRIRARQFDAARNAADKALVLKPQSAEAWYQKATVWHAVGDGERALEAYAQVIQRDASHVEAFIARVGMWLDRSRYDEASADIKVLEALAPKDPRVVYFRALQAERTGQAELARKALRDLTLLVDQVPIDFIQFRPQFLMLNGLAHFGLGEYAKAKQYLEAFHRTQPDTPAAKLLAQIYLAESRAERAIEVLEAYLKVHPADGQAMVVMGSALLARGQHAKAIKYMQQALETRDAPEFRTVLGLGLLKSGQVTGAIPELEAALKLDSGQPQAASALISLYLRNSQSGKAVALAERLIKERPKYAEYHNLLGAAKLRAGDLKGARRALENAITLDEKLVAPRLNLARLDIAEKSYPAAVQLLDAVLRQDDDNAEAHHEMARIAELHGRLLDAERELEKAAAKAGPRDARWALALSNFHVRHKQFVPALKAAQSAASKRPEDVSTLLHLARVMLANNDPTSAAATLSTARRLAQFDTSLLVQIALLQMSAKQLDAAAFSVDKALTGQPDFLPAQALMAEIEWRQGEFAKSERRAREMLAKHPKRAIGQSLLGDIASAQGQTTKAVDAYRSAHQVEPTSETFLRYFNALIKVGADETAYKLAEQWLKSSPRDGVALRALADGHAHAGRYAAARTLYEKLIALSPDDVGALNNLANVLFRLNDPKAKSVAEQALAKQQGNPLALDTLGWILMHQGELDRALQLLREARLRQPGNPEIRYHLAAALVKSNRLTEAREELAAAFDSGRPFEGQNEAKALMKQLK